MGVACTQCGALYAADCKCGWAGNSTADKDRRIRELEAENERLREELADIKTALNDAPGLRFLSEQCGISFQLPGRMDGAMSEDCKILFRRKYQTLAKLIAEFTEGK